MAVVVSVSAANDVTAMEQVARVWLRDAEIIGGVNYPGESSDRSLPITLDLSEDAHLSAGDSVAGTSSLPTGADLIDGMIRAVAAQYYIYDGEWNSGDVAGDPTGYWRTTTYLSTYYGTATTDERGQDRALSGIPAAQLIYPPPYAGDNSLQAPGVVYWIQNPSAAPTKPESTEYSLQFLQSGRDITTGFDQSVLYTYQGLVNLSTGVIDDSDPDVGSAEVWSPASGIRLVEDLPSGYAASYLIQFQFAKSAVPRLVNDANVFINLYEVGLLGRPSFVWYLTGDAVYNSGNRLRIVPDVAGSIRRLDGVASIKKYDVLDAPAEIYSGLAADTTGQKAAISGVNNGAIIIRAAATPLLTTEALRALIGTASGTYSASSYSPSVTVGALGTLEITVDYPYATDAWTVRSDYPDAAIAGMSGQITQGPSYLRIFIEKDGTLYENRPGGNPQAYSIVAGITQTFTISDISTWATSGVTLPDSSGMPSFGLFAIDSVVSVADSGGSLASGSYRAAVAYYYPSPNTYVTSLDHSQGSGCIPEVSQTLTDVLTTPPTLALPSQGSAPSSDTGEIQLYNQSNLLKWRESSDGTVYTVAAIDKAQTYTAAQRAQPTAISISGGIITLNFASANLFTLTLTDDIATVNLSGLDVGVNFQIAIEQDATGGRTIVWPASFYWAGDVDTVNPTASKRTLVTGFSPDGSEIWASMANNLGDA